MSASFKEAAHFAIGKPRYYPYVRLEPLTVTPKAVWNRYRFRLNRQSCLEYEGMVAAFAKVKQLQMEKEQEQAVSVPASVDHLLPTTAANATLAVNRPDRIELSSLPSLSSLCACRFSPQRTKLTNRKLLPPSSPLSTHSSHGTHSRSVGLAAKSPVSKTIHALVQKEPEPNDCTVANVDSEQIEKSPEISKELPLETPVAVATDAEKMPESISGISAPVESDPERASNAPTGEEVRCELTTALTEPSAPVSTLVVFPSNDEHVQLPQQDVPTTSSRHPDSATLQTSDDRSRDQELEPTSTFSSVIHFYTIFLTSLYSHLSLAR